MIFNLLADDPNQQNNWLIWVILGVVVVLFVAYSFWSRKSAKKRQEEAQNILDNLQVGDTIMTIGGICGKIVQVNNAENSVVIETGSDNDKSYLKIDKVAFHHTIAEGPNHVKPTETYTIEKTVIQPKEEEETKADTKDKE